MGMEFPSLEKILLTEEAVTIPSPGQTFEPGITPGSVQATSLEHQVLRSYRSKFNREWYEVRKLLDELQELTTLTYDTQTGFWAPYLRQVDKLDQKLETLSRVVGQMKTLMAGAGVGD